MNEDYDSRSFLIAEAVDVVERARKECEIGSEEYTRACGNAKWMFDAKNRQNEIELKEKQLEQELKIHKDNNRNNVVRNVIEGVKVVVASVVTIRSMKYVYKENGIEFGPLKNFSSSVQRFLHKW